jgi:hypothetical protein
MASGEGNFPVPKIRREPKVRPAMTSSLFENDMTDNLENYAGLSSQRDAGLNWGEMCQVSGIKCQVGVPSARCQVQGMPQRPQNRLFLTNK